MRPVARMALAAATATVVWLPLTGGPGAFAAPSPDPTPAVPSEQQLDQAQQEVAKKKQSVEEIEAELAAATARMEAASQEAAVAFEAYNGARWKLQQAKTETQRAQAASTRAAAEVETQRAGIVQLVTESYQNGTELNAATALMSDEGPQGLMNRYGVVQSAGDSMEAAYERFKIASAKAEKYAGKAAEAEKKQQALAAEARKLAEAAGRAAATAGMVANQIATEKQELVAALAKAQNISIELAKKRADALEAIARRKRAEERRAKEVALQAALHQQALEAEKQAKQAKKDEKNQPKPSDEADPGTPAPAPVANPPANQSVAVRRAIAYAKAQIGKPYVWAADGPSSFDCSGLTMRAWERGGKLLPHYSVAQYAQSTPITMLNARPGDLIFWSRNGSPSGIYHVALYLGGGQFIEAPRTGLNVRYNSIYNWYPDFVARP